MLHVNVDALMNAVILQGADHLQAGAIADMREPRIFVPAKISLQDAPVFCAIEHRAPGFQFPHAIGRFFRVQLGHPPIVDILAAAHRVGEMHFPIVTIVKSSYAGKAVEFGNTDDIYYSPHPPVHVGPAALHPATR